MLSSFSDYRKQQIQETINDVCVKEGIENQFEMLRLELLESIRLPQILSEGSNIAEQAEYNLFVEEDFRYNRAFIEELIHLHKLHFYNELLSEADVAANSPMADMQNFKAKLVEEVKRAILELRDQIKSILNPEGGSSANLAGGDTSGSAMGGNSVPASGAGPAPVPASGAGPAASAMPSPASSSSGSGPSGGGGNTGGSNDPYPRWSANRGEERPEQDGFQPAAYGNKVPTGGIRGGLSRLWRRMTRPVRRVWHGDPTREMGKHMKRESVEQIIIEQWDQIEPILINFEKNILGYIDKSFASIGVAGDSPVEPDEFGNDVEADVDDLGNTSSISGEDGDITSALPDQEMDQPNANLPPHGSQYKRSGPMSRKGYRKAVRNAGIEALGTDKASSGHAANTPQILEKLRDQLDLRRGIQQNDPTLGSLISDYYKLNKTQQKSKMNQIAQHMGALTPSGKPAWKKLASMILQQVGIVAKPDLHMPHSDSHPPENGIEDQVPTETPSTIDPATAAAEKTPHVTEEPPEGVSPIGDTGETEARSETSARAVMSSIKEMGLYDAFQSMGRFTNQKVALDLIQHLLDGDPENNKPPLSAEDIISKIQSKAPATEAPPEAPPEAEVPPMEPEAEVPPMEPEAEVPPMEPEAEVPPMTNIPDDEDITPGVNKGLESPGAGIQDVNLDDLSDEDDDYEDDDEAGEHSNFNASQIPSKTIQDLRDTMGMSTDGMMRDEEDDDRIVDAVALAIVQDVRNGTSLEDAIEDYKGQIQYDLDNLEMELKKRNLLDDDDDEFEELSGDPSDDDDYNALDNNMGFETFTQKVGKMKQQLRESSSMGKSKFKEQRDKLLT